MFSRILNFCVVYTIFLYEILNKYMHEIRIIKSSTLKEAIKKFDKITDSEFKTNCIIESVFEICSNKLYAMHDILNLCYKLKGN